MMHGKAETVDSACNWLFSSGGKNGIMHQDIYIYCHEFLMAKT
jgi:hypothetical protein